MTKINLVSILHLFILMISSLIVVIILTIQLFFGLWNLLINCCRKKLSSQQPVYNFYICHHIIICILRSILILVSCLSIIFFNECLSFENIIHFLLLLSTFNLLSIIIGESAHFWDSTVNHKSVLYSKCCLVFGIVFNYFASILFLSIHLTMTNENFLTIDLCRVTKTDVVFMKHNYDEKNVIPTMIVSALFILIDLLTFSWIYIAYKDISNLKRKSLSTVFFYSLVFTKFNESQRSRMVNHSLKRVFMICLFVISNIIATLPVLILKIFSISWNIYLRIILIYFTTLPWLDCITFLFFNETRLIKINKISKKTTNTNEHYYRQQRIGRRLSAYRESVISTIQRVENQPH